jgi:hypothetical protein
VDRLITSKPGLVKPTNPLVVVMVKQTQHQWTVTLPPPADAEGISSSKILAGFAKMGPQYKVVSEVSGKHQNQKLDCIIERMGEDGLPLLCKRWNNTKSPKDKG